VDVTDTRIEGELKGSYAQLRITAFVRAHVFGADGVRVAAFVPERAAPRGGQTICGVARLVAKQQRRSAPARRTRSRPSPVVGSFSAGSSPDGGASGDACWAKQARTIGGVGCKRAGKA
jgi:hypothetical protein